MVVVNETQKTEKVWKQGYITRQNVDYEPHKWYYGEPVCKIQPMKFDCMSKSECSKRKYFMKTGYDCPEQLYTWLHYMDSPDDSSNYKYFIEYYFI